MSTTAQPRLVAASRALSRRPTEDWRSYAHSRSPSVWWTIPLGLISLDERVRPSEAR